MIWLGWKAPCVESLCYDGGFHFAPQRARLSLQLRFLARRHTLPGLEAYGLEARPEGRGVVADALVWHGAKLMDGWLLGRFGVRGLLHANFVLDTGITLIRRMRRERWFDSHREHFYQRLVRSGKSGAPCS